MYSKPAPLIGLVGYAQAGKDTFGAALEYRRIAFADPLKEMALKCHPELAFWVEEKGWEWAKATYPWARQFLQDLGVAARETFGADIWVDTAFKNYDPFEATVFTDVRFQSEVDAIRKRGGYIVRITREGLGPVNGHVSEQLVGTVKADFEIEAPWDGVLYLKELALALRDSLEN